MNSLSNNTKNLKAFQPVKDLTKGKQAKVNTIQNKNGNSLTEEKKRMERWTEYRSELYNYQNRGDMDLSVLNVPESTNEDKH